MSEFLKLKKAKKPDFLPSEHIQESSEQIKHSRLNFQDKIKVDIDLESLNDSNMCSQVKKYLKSAFLDVNIAFEVDMIEIESKLRAHWEQISKIKAFSVSCCDSPIRPRAEVDGDSGSPVCI